MRWFKSLFRPKPPESPIKTMTAREVEEFILDRIAKGERPPDSAVERLISDTAQKQRKKQGKTSD